MATPDDIKRSNVHPDIIDAFIILILSTALIIFIFWIATQFVESPAFQKLPGFVTGAYSGFWTSIATGATGIGLVIIKSISQRRSTHPNYILYIIVLSIFLLFAIISLSAISIFVTDRSTKNIPQKPSPPFGAFLFRFPADGVERIFSLNTGAPGWQFNFRGRVSLSGRTLKGSIEQSKFETTNLFDPIVKSIDRIDVNSCHWTLINGQWFVDWAPQIGSVNNTREVDIPLKPQATFNLPPIPFSIDVPDGANLDETWLCLRLGNPVGFFPAPH